MNKGIGIGVAFINKIEGWRTITAINMNTLEMSGVIIVQYYDHDRNQQRQAWIYPILANGGFRESDGELISFQIWDGENPNIRFVP